MNGNVLFSVIDIALVIGVLAVYLWVVGGQLTRVATVLEECSDLVAEVKQNTEVIEPGLTAINNTGRVVAGALPLLYGMAEGIVVGATFDHEAAIERPDPARGSRRSRQLEGVGYLSD
jgi:hypothetical protein